MNSIEPTILTDKSRLKEIYLLRCLAWENGPYPDGINFKNYPNGFSEELDEKSIHFVAFNDAQEIIAASRLTIVHSFDELPYPKVFGSLDQYPSKRPFLFFSRLVIHPEYRKRGLKERMDEVRLTFMNENKLPFAVATATDGRTQELVRYGFQKIGEIPPNSDPCFPFKHGEILLIRKI